MEPPTLSLPNRIRVGMNGEWVSLPIYLLPFFPLLDSMIRDMGGARVNMEIPLYYSEGKATAAMLEWMVKFYEMFASGHDIHGDVEIPIEPEKLLMRKGNMASYVGDPRLYPYMRDLPLMELFEFCHFANFLGCLLALQAGLLVLVERFLTDASLPPSPAPPPLLEEIPLFQQNIQVAEYLLLTLPYIRRYLHILALIRSSLHPDLMKQVLASLPQPTMSPVVCGEEHTMLITHQGLMACGSNALGQMGMGKLRESNVFLPVPELEGELIDVACGESHTMLITTRGLFAAGRGSSGQLGTGSLYQVTGFRKVRTEGRPLSVFCGRGCSMLLTTEGLFGCGDNGAGQLGLGDEDNYLVFVRVNGVEGVPLSVGFGERHTMSLTTAGLFACGSDKRGQKGLGDQYSRDAFAKVARGFAGVPLRVACGRVSSLLVTTEGLYGTGSNYLGQLGLGSESSESKEFVRVTHSPPGVVLSLSCGESHTVMITSKGAFGCGLNEKFELAMGSRGEVYSFGRILLAYDPFFVACGSEFTMLLSSRGLASVGDNNAGKLGLGLRNNLQPVARFQWVDISLERPFPDDSEEDEEPEEKKRRLGCQICAQCPVKMRQEILREDRVFCSVACQKRYHWFDQALRLSTRSLYSTIQ
jgi:alpha-tubulin suppressor-like RCC1 family protein